MNPIKKIGLIALGFGFDPRKFLKSILNVPIYIYGYFYFVLNIKKYPEWKLRLFPILSDRNVSSGVASGHYFHQDLWMARQIFKKKPFQHVDIGSRVDGFIAHLLTFMSVKVIDIRELSANVDGLIFLKADITNCNSTDIEKFESVSCLHALEHFGLGRYGDNFDIDGWKVGVQRISNLVLDDGYLYFSVPIGVQAIEYNAHRIFNHLTIMKEFELNGLLLEKFALVNDRGQLIDNGNNLMNVNVADLKYGLGLYIFTKKVRVL